MHSAHSASPRRGRLRPSLALLLLVTLGALAGSGAAQGDPAPPTDDVERARGLVVLAEELAAEGATWDAVATLQSELARGPGEEARAYLEFGLGWLHHRAAEAEPARREELLREALRSYRAGLERLPSQDQARHNLALVEGDLHRTRVERREALAAYDRAFRILPGDATAARRLLDTYAEVEDDWAVPLLDHGLRFERAGLVGEALGAYELLIRRAAHRAELQLVARDALARWIVVESQTQRGLTAAALARLPNTRQWSDPHLASLIALVENPLGAELEPWRNGLALQHAGTCLLAGVARARRADDPAAALLVNERALELAPPMDAYTGGSILGNELPVRLELARAIASILHEHPALDPDGSRFGRIEEDLLRELEVAVAVGSLQAEEMLRATLGRVYAERGRWTPAERRAAPLQLRRAVEAAQRAGAGVTPDNQPRPGLSELLAAGLETSFQPEAALGAWLDATRGYIDLALESPVPDERLLDRAGRTLAGARRVCGILDRGPSERHRGIHADYLAARRAWDPAWTPRATESLPLGLPSANGAPALTTPGTGLRRGLLAFALEDGVDLGASWTQPVEHAPWSRGGDMPLYLGASIGLGATDASSGAVANDIAGALGVFPTVDLDDDISGWKVWGGYRFDAPFALELGYADLGRIDSNIAPIPPGSEGTIGALHPASGSGVTTAVRGLLYGRDRFSLTAGGGLFLWEAEIEVNGARVQDRDGVDPFYGLGLWIDLTGGVALRAEWERFTVDDTTIDFGSLGLQVDIGH